MKVSEIFYSIQGEGILAGVPSVFIRLAGCPLRCRWCDTKYAQEKTGAKDITLDDIIAAVQKWPTRFVVVTGGEPMVCPDLVPLIRLLHACSKHITIETAGIVFVPNLPCDLMSISPKLANSLPDDPTASQMHDKIRFNYSALRKLISHYNYQLKFVVDSPVDIEDIKKTVKQLGQIPTEKVMLMPQAASRKDLIDKFSMVASLCKETGFALSMRLHVMLWNSRKGT